MAFLSAILMGLFVVVCLFLIIVILLQPGKGEGLGALGGMSTQMFGGGGATSFLAKITTGFAVGYMVLVILLAKLTQPSTEIQSAPSIQTSAAETTTDEDAQPASAPETTGEAAPASTDAASDTSSGE